MAVAEVFEEKFHALAGRPHQVTLRLWAAREARAGGPGGVRAAARATDLSRATIYAALRELDASAAGEHARAADRGRFRAKGSGRKKLTGKDPTLLSDLDALLEPSARGDPQSPLRWTSKSIPRLCKELTEGGHVVSQKSVCDLLVQLDYSLQASRSAKRGVSR